MRTRKIQATAFGEDCTLTLADFDKSDAKEWKEIFDHWRILKVRLTNYKSRAPNFPEGLSEIAFCLWSGSSRLLKAYKLSNTSFDTFNAKASRAEQIKACSIDKDVTSFGPKSKWDDLYFMDFYNDGKLDGRFSVYKIPNNLLYEAKVNSKEALTDQQLGKRRPRLSIKELIKEHNIKPLATNVQVW